MSGFNMPPGVSPNMIPGNAPDDGSGDYLVNEVLTLRDYFAAKAMQSILSAMFRLPAAQEVSAIAWDVAADAYGMADAMLKERMK